ncbi:MAG TPA: isoleucine--tRNA ligase [Elusimicrobiales bacterium]|nr:isoleucine--tRNA ligase [Elusimicrobiales bacterium]
MNNPAEKTDSKEYSSTVLLPKTAFPMRAELPKREPEMLKFWDSLKLYQTLLSKRKGRKPYVLHDGPPYANGNIHIGHALNKILKDMTVKSRALSGFYTPYRPGWDCHGLPIEHQLLKELKMAKRHINDVPAFRKKAREFAARFIDTQRTEFKRLGVIGDWENPYLTMSPDYEGAVIEAFLELFSKGYVFRGKKTVYWCATCETALADAEVEYKDKVSHSVYVRFDLSSQALELFGKETAGKRVSIVIWTTTPWTLPANRAAAVAEEQSYRVLQAQDGGFYVVADKLADAFLKESGLAAEKRGLVPGAKLVGLKYRPPLQDRENPIISTDFVAMDTGTGIVHIAPGHGEDDYHAGLRLGLEIFCPVDERGCFTKDAGDFAGQNIFEANSKIAERLKAEGRLLHSSDISHSYPHCWRCKHPVIFRATEQWFLGVDKHGLRQNAVSEIEKGRWVPQGGSARIKSMVENRPDWCLSRQRHWGTPVPMFYCKSCGELQQDAKLFAAVKERALKEGSDFWFTDQPEGIIPSGYTCKCGSREFRKETDILDVWLDSGVSWLAVLKKKESKDNPLYPADLYLEGSDQHRGWFQTSLLPSTALEGKAPFKTVLTHGFVLDETGRAMHKSAGNVVAPQEVIKKYGADILRLWVALSDYADDVRISDKLLEGPTDTYRKFRNTLRYLLGNLWDYEPKQHAVPYEKLQELDVYMLHRLSQMTAQARQHYDEFRYRPAIRTLADFCILELSAFYFDALKDRLYTLGADSAERRSAQTALHETLLALLKLASPVLSFTAEEAWQEMRRLPCGSGLEESVFFSEFPKSGATSANEAVLARWDKIRQLREPALKALEEARKKGVIGSSLEAKVVFHPGTEELQKFLKETAQLWPAVLIVSQAEIAPAPAGAPELEISVAHADGAKCPRCWQWKTDIGKENTHPDLCPRCAKALGS